MKEELLQYIWKNQLYKPEESRLSCNSCLEVIKPGEFNNDAGPDFFNARLKIDQEEWVGNVEIHVKASDWFKHGHHNDRAYDNVVLHVVAENDVDVERADGEKIPVFELSCPSDLLLQYDYLMQSSDWLPCAKFVGKVNPLIWLQWKEALLVERMQEKSAVIKDLFERNDHDLQETFYQLLASNFGFKVNKEPFLMLARALPMKMLAKQKQELIGLEALLLGQAGLLNDSSDHDYCNLLKREYLHYQVKYNLTPIEKHLWKYSKLRPVNFPDLRIVQFAALIYKSSGLLQKILSISKYEELEKLFDIEASSYWNSHFRLGEFSKVENRKKLGKQSVENIFINTVIPFLCFYSTHTGNIKFMERAMDWLLKIAPEKNHIVSSWRSYAVIAENAMDTQALIQLKNKYCKFKKCLHCRIGNQVISYKLQ